MAQGSTTPRDAPGLSRRLLAVLAGLFLGSIANMGVIVVGARLLPPPPGVDPNDVESINAHIGEYSLAQLLVPFVAHALGTFVGAWVAARLARPAWKWMAAGIGAAFLVGGILAVRMIPATPTWFAVLDLGFAYLPMAWLGARLARARA